MTNPDLVFDRDALMSDATHWEKAGEDLNGLVTNLQNENLPRSKFGWGGSDIADAYANTKDLIATTLTDSATQMTNAAQALRAVCDTNEATETATTATFEAIHSEWVPSREGA